MERDEEDDLDSNDSGESTNNSWDRRFNLNYDQKNVRNLRIDEILNRMTELRQYSQSLDTLPGPSGLSTNDQERSISSSSSNSRESNSPPAGNRITFYPEFRRPSSPIPLILNQLPAGCARTAPTSPRHAVGLYIPPFRAPFSVFPSRERASTSHSDWQSLSSPGSPRDSSRMLLSSSEGSRKTPPGHPFGLGSRRPSRPYSVKDSVPIEFIMLENQKKSGMSDDKEKPGKLDEKGGHGESDNKDGGGKSDTKDDDKSVITGDHGKPGKGKGEMSANTLK